MAHSRRKTWMRRGLALLMTLVMATGIVLNAAIEGLLFAHGFRLETVESSGSSTTPSRDSGSKLDKDPNEIVRASIVLDSDSLLEAGYSADNIADNVQAIAYRDVLLNRQNALIGDIEEEVLSGGKLDVVWNLTVAANVISVNIRRGLISDIEKLPGVEQVVEERQYTPDKTEVSEEKVPNMAVSEGMNSADVAWEAGYTGAGSRIAIIDTGLDTDHQSFAPEAFLESISRWETKTGKTAQLMQAQDVLDVLDKLNIATRGVTAEQIEQVYKNAKVPFGYNYVDYSFDVTHDNDNQSEHGSHVAGIAAANRLIDSDKDGVYEDALETVKVVGNAPDAQILVMKVFGKGGGAYDSDCVAAIEDAIWLKADAVNLSLGGSNPGMSTPNLYYDNLMKSLVDSETVVVISAGNSGAWADSSAPKNLYSDGVNFHTGGEPGSYGNSLTVASVENQGTVGMKFTVNGNKYRYLEDTSYGNPHLATLDKNGGQGTDYTFYILQPGTVNEGTAPGTEDKMFAALGSKAKGNIVICWRGGMIDEKTPTSMLHKVQMAEELGAVGVIIVNYENSNIIADLTGYTGHIPVATVQNSVGLAILQYCYDNGGIPAEINSGTITFRATPAEVDYTSSSSYTMSDFSSWGAPGDLSLKPEITAPGGNIYSVNGLAPDGSSYETMSGTSMAAPQITGMVALIQQYLRDQGVKAKDLNVRGLTQSLMMSTAKPMKDASGRYYPVIQQGAGLANVDAAISSPVYITVKGQEDGKVKVELGDDIKKVGKYEITFTLHNLSSVTQYYDLDAAVFTQAVRGQNLMQYTANLSPDVVFLIDGKPVGDDSLLRYDFDGDGEFNRKDAQLLLDYVIQGTEITHCTEDMDVDEDGDVDTHDVHILLTKDRTCAEVPANGETEVKVTITLSEQDRQTISQSYPNGAYIEAFLLANPLASDDGAIPPELSIPVLGFYGNWTDASMYDVGSMIEHDTGTGDTRTPYLGNSNINGGDEGWSSAVYNYFDISLALDDHSELYPYYGNPQDIDVDDYGYFTYYPERNAISGNMRLEYYHYALIRNAGAGVIQVTSEDGKTVYYRQELSAEDGAYYVPGSSGGWFNTVSTVPIDWTITDYEGEPLKEGDKIKLSLIMAPEYYADEDGNYNWDALTDGDLDNGELGKGAYLSTTFTVDLTPPEFLYDDYEGAYVSGWPDYEVLELLYGVQDNQYISNVILHLNDDLDSEWIPISPMDRGPLVEQYGPGSEVWMDQYLSFEYLPKDKWLFDDYGYPYGDFAGVYVLTAVDYAGNFTHYRFFCDVDKLCAPEDVESVEIYQVGSDAGVPYHIPVDELAMLTDTTASLKAIAHPAELDDRSITWKSDNDDIATVSANGLVTAKSIGHTTLRAISNMNNEVEATVDVTVYIIPGTATGILSDNDYVPRLFKWDFGNRTIETGVALATNPVNATQKYGSDHYYLTDTTGMLYEFAADGTPVDGPWNWKGNGPGIMWDIASSKVGIFAVNAGNLFGPYQPDGFQSVAWQIADAIGEDEMWLLTVAAVDEEWQAEREDGVMVGGDVCLYSFDTAGTLWKFYIYWDDEYEMYGLMYERYETTLGALGAYPKGGEPYCSMVVGNDGNPYLSFKGYNCAYLYQLRYTESKNGGDPYYSAYALDQTAADVWPACLFAVDAGEPITGDDGSGTGSSAGSTTHAVGAKSLKNPAAVTTVEIGENASATAKPAVTVKPGTTAGSLNSIEVQVQPNPSDSVLVDPETKTVIVPIRAKESTNGDFVLKYDPSVLTFLRLETTAVLSSAEEPFDAGSIHAGYADAETMNEVVMNAVFSYEPKINEDYTTTLTVETTEDGNKSGKPLSTEDVDITLTGLTVEYDLTIRYVDEEGNDIVEPTVKTLKVGESYQALPYTIPHYTYDHAEGAPTTGTLEADAEVIFVYKSIPYTLTVRYVDEAGKDIADPKTQTVKAGDAYEATPINVANYVYDHAEGAAATGTVDGDTEIVFVYKHVQYTLTVRFVDTNNQQIADTVVTKVNAGDPYQTEAATVKGYKLDHVVGEAKGTMNGDVEVTYVYKAKDSGSPDTGEKGIGVLPAILTALLSVVGLAAVADRIKKRAGR